jgi:hypothetical protein
VSPPFLLRGFYFSQKHMPYKDPIKEKESNQLYYLKNKEKIQVKKHEYYLKTKNLNKEKKASYRKIYYSKNKVKLTIKSKKYRKENPNKIKILHRKYYLAHKLEYSLQRKKWRKENISRVHETTRVYKRNKWKNNIQFKLSESLRNRLHDALKNNYKKGMVLEHLGCTIPELKIHLEKQFQPGMTWGNWAQFGWHVDHIIPLDTFDLTDEKQLSQVCHYTNLQPMWWLENLSKSKKIL